MRRRVDADEAVRGLKKRYLIASEVIRTTRNSEGTLTVDSLMMSVSTVWKLWKGRNRVLK